MESERLYVQLIRSGHAHGSPRWDWDAWPERLAPAAAWYHSPELISLQGTPEWERLGAAARRRVSFHEAVHLASLNVHGERALIERAAGLLGRGAGAFDGALGQIVEEETRHLAAFAGFCHRYAGGLHPNRMIALPRAWAAGEEELVLLARVLVFEEIVDAFDRELGRDARLAPVVRELHAWHHADEARHLAFGRRAVRDLFAACADAWEPDVLARVRRELAGWTEVILASLVSADTYRAAGLADPIGLAARVRRHPATRARREHLTRRLRRTLTETGLAEPTEVQG